MKKKARQDIIKTLIRTKHLGTHSALMKELAKKGIQINQPTISRDLREMGVIKVTKGLGRVIYQLPADVETVNLEEFRHKFLNLVIDINYTANLILIKTNIGEAQGLARAIDGAEFKNILGTVAGDDTILIVVDRVANVKSVLKTFDDIKKGLRKQ